MYQKIESVVFKRLLLIQEKEQLLRELRGINLQGKDELEVREILQQITGLEQDLKAAMEMSSQQIAERLKLNEEKSIILQQLTEAVRLTSYLESQRQRYKKKVKKIHGINCRSQNVKKILHYPHCGENHICFQTPQFIKKYRKY